MMFPAVHGIVGSGGNFPVVKTSNSTTEDTADVISHTVGMPGGIVSGDLLIAIFSVDGSLAGPGDITWPAGWTEFFTVVSVTAVTLSIAYRQADGTEGGSITVTTDVAQRSSSTVYRIEGHKDPTTQAPEVSTGATGTTDKPDPDSLTPTGGIQKYLWLAVHGHDGNKTTSAFPTNYSDGKSTQGGGVDSTGVGSAQRKLNAANDNPGTFTISASEEWVACTIAVHPA